MSISASMEQRMLTYTPVLTFWLQREVLSAELQLLMGWVPADRAGEVTHGKEMFSTRKERKLTPPQTPTGLWPLFSSHPPRVQPEQGGHAVEGCSTSCVWGNPGTLTGKGSGICIRGMLASCSSLWSFRVLLLWNLCWGQSNKKNLKSMLESATEIITTYLETFIICSEKIPSLRCLWSFFLSFFPPVLGIKPRASHMLGKCFYRWTKSPASLWAILLSILCFIFSPKFCSSWHCWKAVRFEVLHCIVFVLIYK